MQLKIKRLNPDAKLPLYGHPHDAGMDICAVERTSLGIGEHKVVRTGIALEIPMGHVGLIWDKSGLSTKKGLKTLGGVIDAGYRGEILIGMINLGSAEYIFEKGDRVAQLLIQKIEQCEVVEVGELEGTSRGESGFGSTGK